MEKETYDKLQMMAKCDGILANIDSIDSITEDMNEYGLTEDDLTQIEDSLDAIANICDYYRNKAIDWLTAEKQARDEKKEE